MVVERGEGTWVWSTEGDKYLDFATGIGVTSLGHCHPKVKAAVLEQLNKIWHAQVNISHHASMLQLIGRLKMVMPEGSGLDTFLLVTTGAEAVEAAVKLARHATKRPNIIVFQGGYHGRTLLTMSMTSSKTIYRGGYGPHASGIHMAPHPYFHQRTCKMDDQVAWALEQLELLMAQTTTPEETAAVVIESVLGEGGYLPPPPGLLEGLRTFCDKYGLLFIADEVQSGFGRTGKMFAIEHAGVRPDILVFAKGIATGFPVAGIAASKALMDQQPSGSQGGTYAGNAVACAAAVATIDTMMSESILANVEERGAQLTKGLLELQSSGLAPICEVRGPGLMIGVEFDASRVEKGTAAKVAKACLSRGMIVLPTGIYETLRVIPPLTVSEEECSIALEIFANAFRDVFAA